MPNSLRAYAYVNAKIKTRIGGLLSDRFFERFDKAVSVGEAAGLLAETPYAEAARIYGESGDVMAGELAIRQREAADLLAVVRHFAGPTRAFVVAVLDRYRIEALRNALRLWFDRRVRRRTIESKIGYLNRTAFAGTTVLDDIINADTWDAVVAAVVEPYAPAVRAGSGGSGRGSGAGSGDEDGSAVGRSPDRRGSLFAVERALDAFYYQRVVAAAHDLAAGDQRFAQQFIGLEIDRHNLSWALRATRPDMAVASLAGGRYLSPALLTALAARAPAGRPASEAAGGAAGTATGRLPEALRAAIDVADSTVRVVTLERVLNDLLLALAPRFLVAAPFSIATFLAYVILVRAEVGRLVTGLVGCSYPVDVPESPAERGEK